MNYSTDPQPRRSPLRSIRLYCIECSAGSMPEVAKCDHDWCPLWHWRHGKHPALQGKKKGKPLSEAFLANRRKKIVASAASAQRATKNPPSRKETQ